MPPDAVVNTARPSKNVRRGLIRSAIRPPVMRSPPNASVYAVMTHCRLPADDPKYDRTTGSAVVTIVTSRTTTNCATQITARGRLRRSLFPAKLLMLETYPEPSDG